MTGLSPFPQTACLSFKWCKKSMGLHYFEGFLWDRWSVCLTTSYCCLLDPQNAFLCKLFTAICLWCTQDWQVSGEIISINWAGLQTPTGTGKALVSLSYLQRDFAGPTHQPPPASRLLLDIRSRRKCAATGSELAGRTGRGTAQWEWWNNPAAVIN